MIFMRKTFGIKIVAFLAVAAIGLFAFSCCCFHDSKNIFPVLTKDFQIQATPAKTCAHCPTSNSGNSNHACCNKIVSASGEFKITSIVLAQQVFFQFPAITVLERPKAFLQIVSQKPTFDDPLPLYEKYSVLRI